MGTGSGVDNARAGITLCLTALAAGGLACDKDDDPAPAGPDRGSSSPAPSGRVRGFVRTVNGEPVPGASVRVPGRGRPARADRRGRFSLALPPGKRTIIARHPAHTRQSVTTRVGRRRPARVDFSLAITDPERVKPPNSASRLLLWTNCRQLAGLSASRLDAWKRRGVDGFVCQTGRLAGLGGGHHFRSNTQALEGARYSLQRQLLRSEAGRRARRGALDLYLGFYAVSALSDSTPFADWFDDATWSESVLPAVRGLAAAARSMGFRGLAIDQELYGGDEDSGPTWEWDYPGHRGNERAVRRKVRQRGRQLMAAIVGAYPGVELVAYDTELPSTWSERVREKVNDAPDAFASDVYIDLWNGLSSVQGYRAIRWLDATFYKAPLLAGASWDTALEYNANMVYSLLSRRFSNWAYASARLHVSPFSWINAGPSPSEYDDARSVDYVAEQLEAFSKWGTGGTIGNYNYGRLDRFDYAPYEQTMRDASAAGTADSTPPELELTTPAPGADGGQLDLRGFARDDLAIRAVRWQDERGREGTARLEWEASGDEREGWSWRMRWSISGLPLHRGDNRITVIAEDIKGLASSRTITVTR